MKNDPNIPERCASGTTRAHEHSCCWKECCMPETLCTWISGAEVDSDKCLGMRGDDAQKLQRVGENQCYLA